MLPETLIIHADANTRIGTGHVMRCLALAQGWQAQGGQVTFISHCPVEGLQRRICEMGAALRLLPELYTPESDPGSLLALIAQASSSGGRWVVLDGYHFDGRYQQAILDAGYRLLVIDDFASLPYYHASLVLNQNINADRLTYHHDPGATLLLGTDYVLLRPEFAAWKGWEREIPPVARRLLVTLGGSDPDNAALLVLRALAAPALRNLESVIVVGASNPHVTELDQVITDLSLNARLAQDVSDMPALMAWADMAVAAGGTTCWELAFMGLPALVMILAENQVGVAEGLDKAGAARSMGWYHELDEARLAEMLGSVRGNAALRAGMSMTGRTLVDGAGVDRVIETASYFVSLRRVTPEDSRLLWEWANDPDTRGVSFSQDAIPWEQHVRWLDAKLADRDCFFRMALGPAGQPIGQVRCDLAGSEAVLSISLSREYRRQGYGSRVLALAARQLFAEYPVMCVHGYVRPDNSASYGAFQRAGYHDAGRREIRGMTMVDFILERSDR
ncbi:MAG: UDP-2,4-diacetamido-2,4,6-trideoxy-beta-L-altropyranose hydrolase [Anaerolineae bacterium]|nr:UDP-2,4-diacetamido-2,4,6-trideoxy-beta-L-altropyranose hydrolase [Anaerolineae bacterium]